MKLSIDEETLDALNHEVAELRAKLASVREKAELFEVLDMNGWRVDVHREDGTVRCMYYCDPCGMFRPCVDTGEFFPSLEAAVRAAITAENGPVDNADKP